jgi:hypothetical protein
MKKLITLLSLMTFALALSTGPLFAQGKSDNSNGNEGKEPPDARIHWARGLDRPQRGSPNLIWHNGPIMTTAQVTAIFWGPSWGSKSFSGDKISGMDTFYGGIGFSTYAHTTDEYTAGNTSITDNITYTGNLVDLSPAKGGSQTSPILAEVCKLITNPVPNGYYPVYVDLARGHAGYCAWHSAGSCGGVPVQFAFFFNLDGDAGCDPQDASGLHSQGLAALANVSGHELSEARTDPQLNAWFDSSGSENADKCAWTFGTPLLPFSNNSQWKIQGNWSNNAYNSSTGYANSSGQKACIDGGLFK